MPSSVIVKTERESNLELLRIVSMLMIIFHHYIMHGIILPCEKDSLLAQSINFYQWENILKSVNFGGSVGVNCFVLISGYFMIKRAASIRKIIILWGTVVFYTVTLFLLTMVACDAYRDSLPIPGISTVFSLLFPCFFERYWFITTYVALCLLSPYLNMLLTHLAEKDFRRLLFVLVFAAFYMHSGALITFISLYTFAAYVRIYNPFESRSYAFWLLAAIACVCIRIVCTICLETWLFNGTCERVLLLFSSGLLYVMAICIFMFFRQLHIKSNKIINTIASTTVGIYLIHDHPEVRSVLWKYLGNLEWVQHPYFILHCVGSVLSVFLVCALLDYIRIKTFARLWEGCVNYLMLVFGKVKSVICEVIK